MITLLAMILGVIICVTWNSSGQKKTKNQKMPAENNTRLHNYPLANSRLNQISNNFDIYVNPGLRTSLYTEKTFSITPRQDILTEAKKLQAFKPINLFEPLEKSNLLGENYLSYRSRYNPNRYDGLNQDNLLLNQNFQFPETTIFQQPVINNTERNINTTKEPDPNYPMYEDL